MRTKTSKKCAKKKEKENPWKCLEKLEEMSWKRREEARADESMAEKEEADANIKRSAVKVRIAYGRSVTCRVWWHSYRYFGIKFNYLFGLL